MPLQKLPVHSLDDINHQRRSREVINHILGHEHDDSRVKTTAETLAGVTVVNPAYPPGDLRRYGAVLDGVTDDRPAFESAYSQWKQAGGAKIILPAGRCYVSQNGSTGYALLLDGDVVLDGQGAFTLVGNASTDYTLIYCNTGTDVKVDIRGIDFDGLKASPVPNGGSDICVRIGSSIDTLNIEGCNFTQYNTDGIYISAAVSGTGGFIRDCLAYNAGRSAITIVKGQKITVSKFIARDLQLQPFTVAAAANTDVLKDINLIDCHVFGGGNYGGAYATTDRCGFFISGKTGASEDDQSDIRAINCSCHDFALTAPGTVPYGFGIETRELIRPIVTGFLALNNLDAGLYSYLTTGAVYQGCVASNNDKGLWMNHCTDYSDVGNTCINNTTKDRDYNGPDGLTTFIQADGLNFTLGRAGLSYSGGAPFLLNGHFNLNVARHGAVPAGDFDFTFDNPAGTADYTVVATYRGHSAAAGGLIQSASHTTSGFRFQTYNAGALSDQPCDIWVIGPAESTTVP